MLRNSAPYFTQANTPRLQYVSLWPCLSIIGSCSEWWQTNMQTWRVLPLLHTDSLHKDHNRLQPLSEDPNPSQLSEQLWLGRQNSEFCGNASNIYFSIKKMFALHSVLVYIKDHTTERSWQIFAVQQNVWLHVQQMTHLCVIWLQLQM